MSDKTFYPDIDSFEQTQRLQRQKGLEKYKKPLSEAGLTFNESTNHLKEEIVDAWNYLMEAERIHQKEITDAYNRGYHDGVNSIKKKTSKE